MQSVRQRITQAICFSLLGLGACAPRYYANLPAARPLYTTPPAFSTATLPARETTTQTADIAPLVAARPPAASSSRQRGFLRRRPLPSLADPRVASTPVASIQRVDLVSQRRPAARQQGGSTTSAIDRFLTALLLISLLYLLIITAVLVLVGKLIAFAIRQLRERRRQPPVGGQP